MIFRIVRAQRPHCALQPRQPYTWPVVRGADAVTALRTAWSVSTLQEQTIIKSGPESLRAPECLLRYRLHGAESKTIAL
jgi:hypothetical protein